MTKVGVVVMMLILWQKTPAELVSSSVTIEVSRFISILLITSSNGNICTVYHHMTLINTNNNATTTNTITAAVVVVVVVAATAAAASGLSGLSSGPLESSMILLQ